MEREASGQGGCCGLILPLFVLDIRHRTGPESASDLRLSWLASSGTAVLSPVSSGLDRQSGPDLIVGSFDVVADFNVQTAASPFRSR